MTINTLTQSNAVLESTTGLINRNPKTTLNQNDFMKLLTVQLTNQDPLKPKEDTEFIAQMASFSSLEQMNSLVSSFNKFNSDQLWGRSINLVGQAVELSSNQETVSGVVQSASMIDGVSMIKVNGTYYPASSLTSVISLAEQPVSADVNPQP